MNSVNKNGMLPLHIATVFNRLQIVDLLIDKGANVNGTDNKFGQTALYVAAAGNREAIAKLLINAGANVNSKIPRGDTSLHAGSMMGHRPIIELLISKGANINAQIMFGVAKGWTPLDIAKFKPDNIEVIGFLKNCGAKTGEELKAEGK